MKLVLGFRQVTTVAGQAFLVSNSIELRLGLAVQYLGVTMPSKSIPTVSILVPVKNGMPYLRSAIQSVLADPSNNFEVIASDDFSDDGSFEYLLSVSDARLTVLRPVHRGLSMSEHWDFLAGTARGTWQMFLGQDDGLQSAWFQDVEALVREAEDLDLRAVVCKRAYFFWPGVESAYGSQRLRYFGAEASKRVSTRMSLVSALLGIIDYFELPQMYTTSLLKSTLLDEIRRQFGGQLVITHPQDASLAATVCVLERYFLRSDLPFSWVGSSRKSAGLAITREALEYRDTSDTLARDYRISVAQSRLPIDPEGFPFELGLQSLYLWSALRSVSRRLGQGRRQFIFSRLFTRIVCAGAVYQHTQTFGEFRNRRQLFQSMEENGVSTRFFAALSNFVGLSIRFAKALRFAVRVIRWEIIRLSQGRARFAIVHSKANSGVESLSEASLAVKNAKANQQGLLEYFQTLFFVSIDKP